MRPRAGMGRSAMALGAAVVIALLTPLVADAEPYLGLYVGATVPQRLTGIQGDENLNYPDPPGAGDLLRDTKVTDVKLDESIMYGAKAGYFFGSSPWLGFETEAFSTTPGIRRQIVTLTPKTEASFREDQRPLDLRVTTLAFNLVARYPGERFQPYAAVGLGVFFAHVSGTGHSGDTPGVSGSGVDGPRVSTSDTALGLNTQLGLRYFVTKQIAVFGEWKFNHARFEFDRVRSLSDVSATYDVHHFAVGVGFHFK